MRHVKFDGTTGVHDQNTIRIDDGVKTMRHSQHGACGKFLANGGLDEVVGAEREMKRGWGIVRV